MSSSNILQPVIPAQQTPGGIPKFQTDSTSGNPRMSALQNMQNVAAKQTALNNAAGGSKRRRIRGGQAKTITLPDAPKPLYHDANSNTAFGANNQITQAMKTTLTQNAQAQLDSKVQPVPLAKMGGRRTKRRNGTKWGGTKWGGTKWGGTKWGCLSGGKRKSKKSRKTRRR